MFDRNNLFKFGLLATCLLVSSQPWSCPLRIYIPHVVHTTCIKILTTLKNKFGICLANLWSLWINWSQNWQSLDMCNVMGYIEHDGFWRIKLDNWVIHYVNLERGQEVYSLGFAWLWGLHHQIDLMLKSFGLNYIL